MLDHATGYVSTASASPPTINHRDIPQFPGFNSTTVEEVLRIIRDSPNNQCELDQIPTMDGQQFVNHSCWYWVMWCACTECSRLTRTLDHPSSTHEAFIRPDWHKVLLTSFKLWTQSITFDWSLSWYRCRLFPTIRYRWQFYISQYQLTIHIRPIQDPFAYSHHDWIITWLRYTTVMFIFFMLLVVHWLPVAVRCYPPPPFIFSFIPLTSSLPCVGLCHFVLADFHPSIAPEWPVVAKCYLI